MRWAKLMATGSTWGTVGSALLLVALAVPACSASGPTTHVNREYGFAIDLDPRFREVDAGRPVPGAGPGALERPDFTVAFADPAGPRSHGMAADVVGVKVIDLGEPVPAEDPVWPISRSCWLQRSPREGTPAFDGRRRSASKAP